MNLPNTKAVLLLPLNQGKTFCLHTLIHGETFFFAFKQYFPLSTYYFRYLKQCIYNIWAYGPMLERFLPTSFREAGHAEF